MINSGQAKSKPTLFCLRLTDCHSFILRERVSINPKLQAALLLIAGSRTLILTALGIEIVRNLQGDVASVVVAVFYSTRPKSIHRPTLLCRLEDVICRKINYPCAVGKRLVKLQIDAVIALHHKKSISMGC